MSPTGRGRRQLGQNFLVDRNAVLRIVAALDPQPGDAVLEIGPGRGALTRELLRRIPGVTAVEVDPRLIAELRRRFPGERLRLIEDDILRVDLAAAVAASDAARRLVVGNLPYSISKPVALKLVESRASVDRAVLMFQKEVAQRLTATPGGKTYGPLTVLCGMAFEISALFDLGPRAFRPRPQVHSTVTHWRRRAVEGFERSAPELRRCLAAGFSRRRQTLRKNLRAALGSAERADALLESAGIDGKLRAEALAPDEFLRLARHWPRGSPDAALI